jgi:hypothetical protein
VLATSRLLEAEMDGASSPDVKTEATVVEPTTRLASVEANAVDVGAEVVVVSASVTRLEVASAWRRLLDADGETTDAALLELVVLAEELPLRLMQAKDALVLVATSREAAGLDKSQSILIYGQQIRPSGMVTISPAT